MRRRWVIGTPDEAAAEIAQLAATYGVDEVMVHPVGGAYADESARTARSRENALSLLAAAGVHAGVHATPEDLLATRPGIGRAGRRGRPRTSVDDAARPAG